MKLAKIIVATDFSQPAEAAVAQGLKLARASGAEIVLAHVGPMPSQLEIDHNVEVNARTEYQRLLNLQLEANREKLEEVRNRIHGQGVVVSKVYGEGEPAETICRLADKTGSSLIVVGTHGRTGFRRLALGSVAERVVRTATSHVLVARPDPRPLSTFENILVATDFSAPSENAIDFAFDLAPAGSTIELFSAWQASTATPRPAVGVTTELWAPIESALVTATEERLAKAAAARRRDGITVTTGQGHGNPAQVVVRQLESGSYDLLVVGSHGRHGVGRWLLGSVSERLVRLAPCSVLVARAPAEAS